MDRRAFLRAAGLTMLGVACARGARRVFPDGFEPLDAVVDPRATNDLNVFAGKSEFVAATTERVPLGLVDPDGIDLVGGGARAWIGRAEGIEGPFEVAYRRFHKPERPEDPGFFVASLPIPEPGIATIVVEHDAGRWGSAAIQVVAEPRVPGVGQPAVPVATPTFGRPRGVANVCTRIVDGAEAPCPMHEERLDRALERLRPIVLSISSPKFCRARTCGPVIEELISVRRAHADDATFIHAEVFREDQVGLFSPTTEAWGIDSEPWTFLIDRDGVIAERFEGPVTAAEIDRALRSLV